jgi:hypothetical protein
VKKLLAPALATALLLAVGAANASLVTYSASYGPEETDWDPAHPMSLQKFNGPGTLNSVTFEFTGQLKADYWIKNTGSSADMFSSDLSGTMMFTLPGALDFTLNPANSTLVLVAADTTSSSTLLADATMNLTPLTTGLADFSGAGSFDVDVLTLANWGWTGGGGNSEGDAVTYATAKVAVTYDYTAPRQSVPEPASLALVGLALAAVACSRRRRA